MFTSLAKSLLDSLLGPMSGCSAALVWPCTIINKVIGTYNSLEEQGHDNRIDKERQEYEVGTFDYLAIFYLDNEHTAILSCVLWGSAISRNYRPRD